MTSKIYYEKNKENILQYAKKYRKENPEKVKESYEQWKKENPNYFKKYHEKNKEKEKEYKLKYNKDKGKEKSKWYRIKKKYNLSQEQWENIYNKQNGKCFICQRTEQQIKKTKSRYLAVDHDHKTGKIRGLLCTYCNRTLTQFFQETPEIIMRVYAYLTKEEHYGIVNIDYLIKTKRHNNGGSNSPPSKK
jgi:hypothetical protein